MLDARAIPPCGETERERERERERREGGGGESERESEPGRSPYRMFQNVAPATSVAPRGFVPFFRLEMPFRALLGEKNEIVEATIENSIENTEMERASK